MYNLCNMNIKIEIKTSTNCQSMLAMADEIVKWVVDLKELLKDCDAMNQDEKQGTNIKSHEEGRV